MHPATKVRRQILPTASLSITLPVLLVTILFCTAPIEVCAQQTGFVPSPPPQLGHYTDYDTLTVGQTRKFRQASHFQNQTSRLSGSLGFAESVWFYTNFLEADGERDALSTGIALGDAGAFGAEDHLTFVTGGSSRLVVNNAGIGVGTTSPLDQLHVEGKLRVGTGSEELPEWVAAGVTGQEQPKMLFRTQNQSGFAHAASVYDNPHTNRTLVVGMMQYSDTNPKSRADFTVNYDDYWYHHMQFLPNKEVHFQRQRHVGSTDAFGDVVFHTNTRFNANVGIGTSDPGEHALAVEGGIGARKIVVTDASFADYVFEDGYNLRSLDEVRSFIDAHGHLPGMPSGETVEREGQDLGGIQVALTEKVEELVLYAIQQQQRVKTLDQEVETLKAELGQLQAVSAEQDAQIKSLQAKIRAIYKTVLDASASSKK